MTIWRDPYIYDIPTVRSTKYLVNPGTGTVVIRIKADLDENPSSIDPDTDDVSDVTKMVLKQDTVEITGAPSMFVVGFPWRLLQYWNILWVEFDIPGDGSVERKYVKRIRGTETLR